jgi:hypothetical protein
MLGWGPLTHREFVTWQAWLDEQWNKPSRTDFYLMRIAYYLLSEPPHDLNQMKIPFEKKSIKRRMSKTEATQMAKNKWLPAVGLK